MAESVMCNDTRYWQDRDFIELFSGKGEVSRSMRKVPLMNSICSAIHRLM